MSQIIVDYEALADMARRLLTVKAGFDGVEGTTRAAGGHLGASRVSHAVEEFGRNWSDKRKEISTLLQQVADAANDAANTYKQTEQHTVPHGKDSMRSGQTGGPKEFAPVDTDGDGTPDYRDTDSDNDGIPDAGPGSGSGMPISSGLGISDAPPLDTGRAADGGHGGGGSFDPTALGATGTGLDGNSGLGGGTGLGSTGADTGLGAVGGTGALGAGPAGAGSGGPASGAEHPAVDHGPVSGGGSAGLGGQATAQPQAGGTGGDHQHGLPVAAMAAPVGVLGAAGAAAWAAKRKKDAETAEQEKESVEDYD